jgi:hypothetical protein
MWYSPQTIGMAALPLERSTGPSGHPNKIASLPADLGFSSAAARLESSRRTCSWSASPTVQPCAFNASRSDRVSCACLHAREWKIGKIMPEGRRKMLDAVAALGFATVMM